MTGSGGSLRWARTGTAIAVLILSAVAGAHAQAPPSYYVLSVGVNKYRDRSLTQLKGSVNDAKGMVALFEGRGLRAKQLLLDDEANFLNVVVAFDRMEKEVEDGDFVVIFLSGHGGLELGRLNFLLHDFSRFGGLTLGVLDDLTIMLTVDRLIKRGHTVLLAVDCCQAGQVANSWPRLFHAPDDGPRRREAGLIFLGACVSNQFSKDGRVNSLFTKTLLEALRGAADSNKDGLVTLKEVRSFLGWRMRENAYKGPRFPGLPWPDQDCVCVASVALAEGLALIRAEDRKPIFPGEQSSTVLLTKRNDEFVEGFARGPRPVGTWRTDLPAEDDTGRKIFYVYVLTLRDDGRYTATLYGPGGEEVERAAGRYDFLGRASFLDPDPRRRPHFILDYGNGYDEIVPATLTDDEMTIAVYRNPSFKDPSTYTFRRVRAEPAAR